MSNCRFLHLLVIIVLVWAALPNPVWSQEQPATNSQAESTRRIPPDTPVLTIEGSCPPSSSKASKASCATVLTRSEFDTLVNVVDPNMSPTAKSRFANSYATSLLFAHAAQHQGLDKDPQFRRLAELAQTQLLGQTYQQALLAKSKLITPDELEKFYRDNSQLFEVVDLLRIFVPGDAASDSTDSEKAVDMKAIADNIRARAAAGEDFSILQRDAFKAAHLDSPPAVNLDKMSRSRLGTNEKEIFDLKPGQISAVLPVADGYAIYKIVDRQIPPLTSVKEQVEQVLQTRRFNEWIQKITGSAKITLNDQYFTESKEKSADKQAQR